MKAGFEGRGGKRREKKGEGGNGNWFFCETGGGGGEGDGGVALRRTSANWDLTFWGERKRKQADLRERLDTRLGRKPNGTSTGLSDNCSGKGGGSEGKKKMSLSLESPKRAPPPSLRVSGGATR